MAATDMRPMTAPGLSEQELAEIDAQVAKLEGLSPYMRGDSCYVHREVSEEGGFKGVRYQPTRDPAEAMRLLVRHGLRIWPEGSPNVTRWGAMPSLLPFRESSKSAGYGETPMLAICRAVISIGAPK